MVAAIALGTGAATSAAHPFSLEVNGTDVITATEVESIAVTMPGPGTNGSMAFRVSDPGLLYALNEWDEVRFVEHAGTTPNVFGGFVQNVDTTSWAAGGRYINLTCVGYGVLLDRKVVQAVTDPSALGGSIDFGIGDNILGPIGRFGGRVVAFGASLGNRSAYVSTPDQTVPVWSDWVTGAALTTQDGVSLRQALESWFTLGTDVTGGTIASVAVAYWVDAYARFHAHPLLSDGAANAFDGDCPVAIAETTGAGLVRATRFSFSRNGSDVSTSSFVQGGNANGTGFVRGPAYERAGDLEDVFNHPESTSASLKAFYGGGDIAAATGPIVSGEADIESDTPIDIRPGQKLTVTSTPHGLSGATYRIGSVRITYSKPSHRVYTVGFGGRERPSIARRLGKSRRIGH